MHRNVPLRLEEELLKKARHIAVDRHLSLSSWMTRLLEHAVRAEDSYTAARSRAIQRLEKGMDLSGKPLTREEAHER